MHRAFLRDSHNLVPNRVIHLPQLWLAKHRPEQGRPFHRSIDAACVLEKTVERKSCTFSRKLGEFYQNISAYSLAQMPQKDTKTFLSCQQLRWGNSGSVASCYTLCLLPRRIRFNPCRVSQFLERIQLSRLAGDWTVYMRQLYIVREDIDSKALKVYASRGEATVQQ
jgi:hypothetical protein